ncbi:MAG: hypothetical protein AAFP97_05015 [Pseudomonadota bacterium]
MNPTYVRSLLISAVAFAPMLAAANLSDTDDGALNAVSEVANGLPTDIPDPALAERIEMALPEPKPYSVSLMKVSESPVAERLDWKNQSLDIRFDLLEADYLESLSLTLNARALRGTDAGVPLILQFNGGTPIEIQASGQNVETVIDLPPTRARKSGNVLTLSHATRCDVAWGGYEIDLSRSRLDMGVSLRQQALELRDLEALFTSPTFAPQRIGLVSGGPAQTKLQALAAQAIGLRMKDIPEFRLSSGESDLDIIMVRRDQLVSYTDDQAILLSTGPQIALTKATDITSDSRRLFLTGDTDDEVLEAVSAFSKSYLPSSRQSTTTPEQVAKQNPLDADRHLVSDRLMLDMLSVQTGLHREYSFDVADPAASQGELLLRLNRDRQTTKSTILESRLNGVSLGKAQVRGRRMTVSYPIELGLLKGQNNRLEFITTDPDTRPTCSASEPFIAISDGSQLQLLNENPTAETDLSRFAATGSIFAEGSGQNSVLILPERDFDYVSALQLVAKMARTNGTGWTDASFVRGETDEAEANLLYIEPYAGIERHIRLNAPRALQSAWRGLSADDQDEDTVKQFASLDGELTLLQASTQLIWMESPLGEGGVAALYPNANGQMIGVISNTQDIRFTDAIAPLLKSSHWNELKGGVAHWNNDVVMMTQSAFPLPSPETEIVEFQDDVSFTQRAKALASVVSDVDWPEAEPAALGAWLDHRWRTFSLSVRAQAQSPEVQQVKTAVTDKINAVPDAAREALESQTVSDIRRETLAGLENQRAQIQTVAADLRRDLWTHLDIKNPDLKSAGVGQIQVLPIVLIVAILFLMILIGVAFAAPAHQSPANQTRPQTR